ncbi:hypothetical protein ACVII1_006265 [Bradyrhizobium elkanii]|uniref:hypothetical protein n=1 Tax=Bradyrhizobium TaxID=374 RepID=UPI002711D493|nr:hypothetical protein [Bradyrhizobium elkanii]WLA40199.1 hypothetical protein QNJ95_01045 [Bradyrhizobium elkanii]
MVYVRRLAAGLLSLAMGGCAVLPDLPPDWALPVQEIVLHASCELQFALNNLQKVSDPKKFDPAGWTIKVTLNPKVDADIQPGAGLTRSASSRGGTRSSNFVIGGGNGATADLKGTHNGSVDFKFDSAVLMKDAGLPCNTATPSYHTLTKYLGIQEWLFRAVDTTRVTGASIDSPSFTAEVVIKFSGSGGWTYTLPAGTDLLSLSGYYQLDESLTITFTAKPKVDSFKVVTLPKGGKGFGANSAAPLASTVSIIQEQNSSLQQIRQQLQNLRLTQ